MNAENDVIVEQSIDKKEANYKQGKDYCEAAFACGLASLFFNPLCVLSIIALILSNKAISLDAEFKDNTLRQIGKVVAIITMVLQIILIAIVILACIVAVLAGVSEAGMTL